MRLIFCLRPILSCIIYFTILPDLSWMTAFWLVDDLVQVLLQADMAEVLKDFGKHMGKDRSRRAFLRDLPQGL